MNDFINKFLPLEHDLFLALNGGGSAFWDNAMWTYTGLVTWVPMFLFIIYISFRNQQLKEGLFVLGALVLVLLLSNLASGFFFKPLFQRYRPSHHPDYKDLVTLVNGFRGGDYGFISGHATNSFALAFFVSRLFRNRIVTFSVMFWAISNSYSRIYLGVHFISDILAGLIVGALIGLLVYEMYTKLRVHYSQVSVYEDRNTIYSQKQGNILGVTIISYIILVILFSPILTSFSHSIIPESWF